MMKMKSLHAVRCVAYTADADCVDMLSMEPHNKGDRRIIVCVQDGRTAVSAAMHGDWQVR